MSIKITYPLFIFPAVSCKKQNHSLLQTAARTLGAALAWVCVCVQACVGVGTRVRVCI